MIDFRYHLVSIVAVFLALAIGIVFGSTALRGPLYNALNKTSASLKNDYNSAENQLNTANQLAGADDAFIKSIEASYLSGKLTGQRIIMFTEPGESSAVVSGVTQAAQDAGATVVEQVNLTNKFFDTSDSTEATLAQINSDVGSGIALESGMADPQQEGTGQVLAQQLLTKATASTAGTTSTASWQASTGQTAQTAQTALSAYQQAGFLTVSGGTSLTEPGTLAVLVTTNNVLPDGTSDPLAQVLGPFAEELAARSSGTVVAGTAAASGAGSPIAELRATSSVSNQVSSVDDADTIRGQESVVDALYATLTGGPAQSYGINAGTYPAPDPTVSPTPASTPSPSSSSSSSISCARRSAMDHLNPKSKPVSVATPSCSPYALQTSLTPMSTAYTRSSSNASL